MVTKLHENTGEAFRIQVTGATQLSKIVKASMPTLVYEGGGQRGIFAAGERPSPTPTDQVSLVLQVQFEEASVH